MRQEPEFFGDRELVLVYVARKLTHAQQIEGVLADGGVDFAVEADKYVAGFLFRKERIGAFFYVAPENEQAARQVLQKAGHLPFSP
jgi:hypothetical protein